MRDWNKEENKVREWFSRKGYRLVHKRGADDSIDFSRKTVLVNSNYGPRSRCFTALHEAGHLLIHLAHRAGIPADCPHACSSTVRGHEMHVYVIAEEIEAWNRGLRLANRLLTRRLDSQDTNRYRKMTGAGVMTYVTHAAKRNRGRRR